MYSPFLVSSLFKKGFFSSQIKKTSNSKIRIKDILTEINDKTSTNNEYEIISSTSNGFFYKKNILTGKPQVKII